MWMLFAFIDPSSGHELCIHCHSRTINMATIEQIIAIEDSTLSIREDLTLQINSIVTQIQSLTNASSQLAGVGTDTNPISSDIQALIYETQSLSQSIAATANLISVLSVSAVAPDANLPADTLALATAAQTILALSNTIASANGLTNQALLPQGQSLSGYANQLLSSATTLQVQITGSSASIRTLVDRIAFDEKSVYTLTTQVNTIAANQVNDESNIAAITAAAQSLSAQVSSIAASQLNDEANIASLLATTQTLTKQLATVTSNQVADESNFTQLLAAVHTPSDQVVAMNLQLNPSPATSH